MCRMLSPLMVAGMKGPEVSMLISSMGKSTLVAAKRTEDCVAFAMMQGTHSSAWRTFGWNDGTFLTNVFSWRYSPALGCPVLSFPIQAS